jgi:hypothetical protein
MKQKLAVLFAVVGFGDWGRNLRLLFAIGSGLRRPRRKALSWPRISDQQGLYRDH